MLHLLTMLSLAPPHDAIPLPCYAPLPYSICSKATFAADEGEGGVELDDPEFWSKVQCTPYTTPRTCHARAMHAPCTRTTFRCKVLVAAALQPLTMPHPSHATPPYHAAPLLTLVHLLSNPRCCRSCRRPWPRTSRSGSGAPSRPCDGSIPTPSRTTSQTTLTTPPTSPSFTCMLVPVMCRLAACTHRAAASST